MSSIPLVIVAAAAREAAAVRRAFRVQSRGRLTAPECAPTGWTGRCRYWEWEARGRSVVTVQGGVGSRQCAQTAEMARLCFKPQGIMALGFAGALRTHLRPGALVVAERTRPEGDDGPDLLTVAADAAMIRAAVKAGEVAGILTACGALVTVPALAATPEAKAALAASTGAVAVDMEAGAVATVAARAGLPFLAAKVILDAADESLHPALMDVVRPDGTPRFLYAAYLAARDGDVRAALHWAGRRSRLAATVLTRFCRALFPILGAWDRGSGDRGRP